MKLLLDTHTLLWWYSADPRLSAVARDAIANTDHEVRVSAASIWEIATKSRIGKLRGVERLLSNLDAFIAGDLFQFLAISHRHALLAGGFAQQHRDPFDRMLAAQALIENAVLVTDDAAIHPFGVTTLW